MSKKAKIFIVDDHPILRQGLKQLLNNENDLSVCGEAVNGQSALETIKSTMPDIAVIDISLEGMDGLELIKMLKSRMPNLKILVLSMHDESIYAERAIRAGAKGYVMKEEAADVLVTAIRKVLNGQIHLSPSMSNSLLKQMTGDNLAKDKSLIDTLSDRELEVFNLIGRGFKTREVADRLYLSVKTVETYRENIKSKMGIRNATELVRHAVNWVERKKA